MREWADVFASGDEFIEATRTAHHALRRVFAEDDTGVEIAAAALLMRSIAKSGVSPNLMLQLSQEIFEHGPLRAALASSVVSHGCGSRTAPTQEP